MVLAPDPLYDHSGETYPERAWRIVTTETTKLVDGVVSPDFGQKSLQKMPEDSLLQKDLASVKTEEVESFIQKYYLLFDGINRLNEPELTTLEQTICASNLYKLSKAAASQYVSSLLELKLEERAYSPREVIFFAGFLDRYVLVPIANRKKALDLEKAKGVQTKENSA